MCEGAAHEQRARPAFRSAELLARYLRASAAMDGVISALVERVLGEEQAARPIVDGAGTNGAAA